MKNTDKETCAQCGKAYKETAKHNGHEEIIFHDHVDLGYVCEYCPEFVSVKLKDK